MKHISRFISMFLAFSLMLTMGIAPAARAAASPFSDLPGGLYDSAITTLADYGVVTGLEPTKFVPGGPVTRAQMAALIVRAMGKAADAEALKSVSSEYSDVPAIHWAKGTIALASRLGIIKGDGGRFFPNDPVNYAQAATMMVRALGYEDQVTGEYPTGYVLKANELGILKDLHFELFAGVNRAEAAVLLYNAIFRAPVAQTGLTWSQTVFKRAKTLSLGTLPAYAAPGQQIPLSAVAADPEGKPIADLPVQFQITGGSGEIHQNTLTVGNGDSVTVAATLSGLTANATVNTVTDLAVEPATFQASKGGVVTLHATAKTGGNRVTVQPRWTVVSGQATINDQGVLTVNDFGSVTVQATLGTLTAVVTGQAVGKVTVSNQPEYLVPGTTYNLAAVATDPAGRTLSIPVTWSATGAAVDSNGRLSGPYAAQVTVKATAGGISDQVTLPVLQSIQVTGSSSAVLAGKTVTFKAKGLDAAGKQHDVTPIWNRSATDIGIIDANGVFVGIKAGSTAITADVGSLRGQATALVSGPPARVSITAVRTSLPVGTGATTEITVRLLDQAGNLSPVDDQPIVLTLSDTGHGSLNRTLVLSQGGEGKVTYTAGTSVGNATVGVSVPGLNVTTQALQISTYQPAPTYIQLSADPQTLATGGGVATVTATLRDANNLPVPAPQTLYVSLTAVGAYAGGLTGTTITIGAGQTSGSLSFISGSTPGSVSFNGTSTYQVRGTTLQTVEAGPAAKVHIRPVDSETPVTGLSALAVQVEVLDAAGIVRANDNASQVQLTISIAGAPTNMSAPTINPVTVVGGIASFQVPAYTVGTATLTATLTAVPGATDTTTAKFVPGVFSSLRLTAQPASLPADGFSQTQLVAEVVDRSGNVVSSINPMVTFRKLVDVGATNALSDLRVQAVGGKAVLTLQAGRLVGADMWYATATGIDTQNLATVTTTATNGDAYTLRVSGTTSFALGSPGTLNVQVVDQLGRVVVTDSNRIITISGALPGVTINPTTAATLNGTATFLVTGTQVTSGMVTFSSPGLAVPSVQQTISIGGATSTAYSLFASTTTDHVRYGTAVTVSVWVKDNQGNTVTSESGRMITARVDGPATITPSATSTVSGMASFTLLGTGQGTATVTLSTTGLTQSSTTLTITFTN